MKPIIKRVTEADAGVLAALSAATFFDTFKGTCTVADMNRFLETNFNIDQVKTELLNTNDLFYFAELEGKPVGYLRIMEDYESFPMMRKWKALELKRIYVDKDYHGKGIAQSLMQFMETYAADNHFEVIWLGVWEHNERAKKFYAKYGFIDSGYKHDFPIGSTPQTDHWLWKFL